MVDMYEYLYILYMSFRIIIDIVVIIVVIVIIIVIVVVIVFTSSKVGEIGVTKECFNGG